jgi:hypothetical protein
VPKNPSSQTGSVRAKRSFGETKSQSDDQPKGLPSPAKVKPKTKTGRKQAAARMQQRRAKIQFDGKEAISTYFALDTSTGEFSGIPGKRPGNQSSASTVSKVVEWLSDCVPANMRHTIQQHFIDSYNRGDSLSEMNDGEGIDIAHVISAKELKEIVTGMLNIATKLKKSSSQSAIAKFRKTSAGFASGFITTDASDQDEIEDTVDKIIHGTAAKERGEAADKLLSRLNRVRKNLTGGDASTNRRIAEDRDEWTQTDGAVVEPVKKRLKLVHDISGEMGLQEKQPMLENGVPVTSTFSKKYSSSELDSSDANMSD